mgnify:CR=1 FL=1
MEAKVFNFIRDKVKKIKLFEELLNCSLCTGFWTGLITGVFAPYNTILFALYSSVACYFIYLVNCILLNKVYPNEKD